MMDDSDRFSNLQCSHLFAAPVPTSMTSWLVRRRTRTVMVGGLSIGGDAPVSVQTMTKTDTRDVARTVRQIKVLEAAGCDLVRLAIPDALAAEALGRIRRAVKVPLAADIHFDYRLALLALDAGANKLRLNPGNIGSRDRVAQVVAAAKERGVPIRIGVNAGSLEKDILAKYGKPTPNAMVESAFRAIQILQDNAFEQIVVSLKASEVGMTLAAYRELAAQTDFPLHLGITEAGSLHSGTIRSAVGIGTLLAEGIGATLRVSLTAHPKEEVRVGQEILASLDLVRNRPTVISCPTCGRVQADIFGIVREVEKRSRRLKRPLRIAVMGCEVNGPGEAREADVGLAAGRGGGLIFRRGQVVAKVKAEEMLEALWKEIANEEKIDG